MRAGLAAVAADAAGAAHALVPLLRLAAGTSGSGQGVLVGASSVASADGGALFLSPRRRGVAAAAALKADSSAGRKRGNEDEDTSKEEEEEAAWGLLLAVCPGPAAELHCIAARAQEASERLLEANGADKEAARSPAVGPSEGSPVSSEHPSSGAGAPAPTAAQPPEPRATGKPHAQPRASARASSQAVGGRRWVHAILDTGLAEAFLRAGGAESGSGAGGSVTSAPGGGADAIRQARQSALGPSAGAGWERLAVLQRGAAAKVLARAQVLGAGRTGPCGRLVQDAWALVGTVGSGDEMAAWVQRSVRQALRRPMGKLTSIASTWPSESGDSDILQRARDAVEWMSGADD